MSISQEDLRKMLQDAGLSEGLWGERKAKRFGMPKVIKDSKKVLETTKHLIEKQIDSDKKAIAEAHVALSRLEHGGGS